MTGKPAVEVIMTVFTLEVNLAVEAIKYPVDFMVLELLL